MPTLFVLGICVIYQSCSERELFEEEIIPEVPVKFPLVQEELRPYFERFEVEAAALGLEVDLTEHQIRGRIAEIHEDNVAGQCSYNYRNPHLITIDESFWNRSSDLFKEFIIFHELGHCYLGRGHLEDSFNNGICKSLMRSGTGFCVDYYRRDTRDYYINELFFPEDEFLELPL